MFQGTAATIASHHLEVLLRVEPSAKELTLEEYENCMGIGRKGGESKEVEDVISDVGQDTDPQDETPLHAPRTRQEAIKELRGRGFEFNELKSKTKKQLFEML